MTGKWFEIEKRTLQILPDLCDGYTFNFPEYDPRMMIGTMQPGWSVFIRAPYYEEGRIASRVWGDSIKKRGRTSYSLSYLPDKEIWHLLRVR